MAKITSAQVWKEIENQIFAVIGMVTAHHESRTAGVVYIVRHRQLLIASTKSAWKTRHLATNPHVSVTIPIAKQIPFIPIKIPPATITFSGVARVLEPADVAGETVSALFRGMEVTPETSAPFAIIEVTPEKEFVTYGVGVSLLTMRDPDESRGRAPVA